MLPDIFILLMFTLGLLVGSFLNVVIHRLPIMMEREWRTQCRSLLGLPELTDSDTHTTYNLIMPRSSCPHCHQPVRVVDNIPLVSYVLLRGKCRDCATHISLRYPAIELTSAILTAYIAWYFGFDVKTICAVLLTWALLCLSIIDIDKHLLPDDITLPFLWLGLVFNIFNVFTDSISSLIGAMLGYTVLWLIFILFKIITGKEGIGYGDFKLLAMLGAWLGWEMLPLIILLASLLGSLAGLFLIIFRNHNKATPVPFGPYLALSGWIALLCGSDINRIYLSFV